MNKDSKIYRKIKTMYRPILEGKMLCIDPSTGSQSSVPGFAYFEKGKLIESGEITLDVSLNRSKRLYEISRTIREEFPLADVLAVEYIPPVTYKRKPGGSGGMNSVSIMALQKAIGAILAAHPYENLLEIPVASWRVWKTEDYIKTDEWDAITMGLCAVGIADYINREG